MRPAVYQATAPSNIAFLKYWGKADESLQWPANDSLSMTLSGLCSTTEVQIMAAPDHEVYLSGQLLNRSHSKGRKIFNHIDFLASQFKQDTKLKIQSQNSFPTGCGIASSASGMAALTIAVLAAWFNIEKLEDFPSASLSLSQLAQLSRMGSGSAGRSLYGGFVRWQKGTSAAEQSIVPAFAHHHWSLMDTVVLFSSQEKSVGSTEAHRAAWTSPLFKPRLAGIEDRLQQMLSALAHKDMKRLGPLMETETLEMHGVIMSAKPAVFYFDQKTADFLAWVRHRRQERGIPVYFTLDAGPNVHLIYESEYHKDVLNLLSQYPEVGEILSDEIGSGPVLKKIESEAKL